MAELDDLLRDVLTRTAEPGDPAGVADRIRERVAAGDVGTPSPETVFPTGWGSWLPWIGAGAVAVIVGGAAGVGIAGGGQPADASDSPVHTVTVATVSGGVCPGGTGAAEIVAGSRILALARSDDSAHLEVRVPYDPSRTVWVPLSVVSLDEADAVDSLPVDGCDEPLVTAMEPSPEPEPEPEPQPEPGPRPDPQPKPKPDPPKPPQPPVDNPPTLGAVTVNHVSHSCEATVVVSASDDKGVAQVTVSWSGGDSGSATMTGGAGTWSYLYTMPASTSSIDVTFTVRAQDTAGQWSSPKTVTRTLTCFF